MSAQFSYTKYASNSGLMETYAAYQRRYAERIRESDKLLIGLVERVIAERSRGGPRLSLLDVGCSTGNLLLHLRKAYPGLELTGGDLASSMIESCKADPALDGIRFEVMDMLNIRHVEEFDVVIANAVTYLFNNEEYTSAIRSVSACLKPGGWFFSFEWLHPFEHDIEILETSRTHPKGLRIHARPYSSVSAILSEHGFANYRFQPFSIPIDLPRGATYGPNEDGFEDLNSYTVKTETGERLLFRGALFQPWCHLIAQKTP